MHIGYVSLNLYRTFYGDTVKNILAWLDGSAFPAGGVKAEKRRYQRVRQHGQNLSLKNGRLWRARR
jgi:hypothetical protein